MKFNKNVERNMDWQSLYNTYLQWVFPEAIVLEIGASTPDRTEALAEKCKKLIGIELMPERLPTSHGNIEYRQGDWEKLTQDIEPNSIDIAVSSHVIEHVKDDLKALNELYEVLKPGGKAVLNTPNRKRLTRAIIETFTAERQFPWWEHQREYIEADLVKLIEKSKFKKYEIKAVAFGINGGPFKISMKQPPKMWRKLANFWEIHLFKE